MNNPDTLATLGIQDTGRRQTTQEATRISNIGATKPSGVNPSTHEGHTVPVSHKTPAKIYLYQAISLIID